MADRLRRFHCGEEILMANRPAGMPLAGFLRRQFKAHARLFIATAVGLLVWIAIPAEGVTRFLIGWNAATWIFLALILKMMYGATSSDIARRAGVEEEGRGMMLAVVVLASIAIFVAIGSQLAQAVKDPGVQGPRIFLALATIFGSWLFMNFAFAIHYAHEFHTSRESGKRGTKPLAFPGGAEPDYWDFLYFAMVVGTTFQTSDVEINSRALRRNVLVHGLIAFLYNTAVIALTVNIAAQFFGGGK
jgi:uncharacterized membrane protein